MTKLYRKPCTSPHEAVRRLFESAEANGMGITALAERSGYSANTLSELRRPRGGRGASPSFALVRDVALVLGYDIQPVPCHEP